MSEEPQFTVIVYSKYSSTCQSILSNPGLNPLISSGRVKLLCSDHSESRKTLLTAGIAKVPTVLFIFPDRTEKFDSDDTPAWLEEQLRQAAPEVPAAAPQPPTTLGGGLQKTSILALHPELGNPAPPRISKSENAHHTAMVQSEREEKTRENMERQKTGLSLKEQAALLAQQRDSEIGDQKPGPAFISPN